MFGLFPWLRRLRAARLPFPEAWRAILRDQVPFYAQLAPAAVPRFERKLQILVHTKHFEGAGGFVVDDRVRVVVAAAAARLIMNMPGQHYQRLGDIVIYPDDYRHPGGAHDQVVFGEAHHHGTVVLSWAAVLAGLRNPDDGHDTATHEFAHVLDAQDGSFDGTPVLKGFAAYGPWARVMSRGVPRPVGQAPPQGAPGPPGVAAIRGHQRGRVLRGRHRGLLREAPSDARPPSRAARCPVRVLRRRGPARVKAWLVHALLLAHSRSSVSSSSRS